MPRSALRVETRSRRRSARTAAESPLPRGSASAANVAARARAPRARGPSAPRIGGPPRRTPRRPAAPRRRQPLRRRSGVPPSSASRPAREPPRPRLAPVLPPLRLERRRVLGSLRGEPRLEFLLLVPAARARKPGRLRGARLRAPPRLGARPAPAAPRAGEPQDRRRLRVALLGVRLRLAERLPLRLQAALRAALRVREPGTRLLRNRARVSTRVWLSLGSRRKPRGGVPPARARRGDRRT